MLPVWGIRLDKLPYAWIWVQVVSLGHWHDVGDGRRKGAGSCEGNITGPHPRSNNVRDFMIKLGNVGAGGKLVAFLHPKSTHGVLTEICSPKPETIPVS